MKKVTFLLVVTLLTGLFISTFPLGLAQTSTPVNGIITQDTTWTKTNSPYNLTGNVLIEHDATVTIEVDATVNLQGYYIKVNGTLVIQPGVTINMGVTGTNPGAIQVNGVLSARGTSVQPICLNGAIYWWGVGVPPSKSSIAFSPQSLSWNQQTSDGCIIEKAMLENVGVSISNSARFDNNTVSGAGISITGGSPIITHSMLSSGDSISISGGSPIIANNQLEGGYIFINGAVESPIIANNIICNSDPRWPYASSASISVVGGNLENNSGKILIKNNLLQNSAYGIQMIDNKNFDINKRITIEHNTIIKNGIGIAITDKFASLSISNNNIYANNASFDLSSSKDVNASNNWWGTTNESEIEKSIHDYNDDFNFGRVIYLPILTGPDQSAPDSNSPIPEAVIADLSSSENLTPTHETDPLNKPSQSETTLTDQPSSQSGFSISPEGIVVIIVVSMTGVSLLILAFKRGKKNKGLGMKGN